MRQRRLEGGDGGGRAAAGAAGDAARGPTGCGSGRRRSARSRSPSRTRPCWSCRGSRTPASRSRRDDGRVVRRHASPRGSCDPQVVGMPSVASTSLSASGTPASGPSVVAGGAARVDGRGRGERAVGVDVQERVDGAVDGGDAVEVRLGDLDRARPRRRRRRPASSAAVSRVRSVARRSLLVQDARDPEALVLDGGGAGERLLGGQRRADDVLAEHVGQRQRVARRRRRRRPATSATWATAPRITPSWSAKWSSSASAGRSGRAGRGARPRPARSYGAARPWRHPTEGPHGEPPLPDHTSELPLTA